MEPPSLHLQDRPTSFLVASPPSGGTAAIHSPSGSYLPQLTRVVIPACKAKSESTGNRQLLRAQRSVDARLCLRVQTSSISVEPPLLQHQDMPTSFLVASPPSGGTAAIHSGSYFPQLTRVIIPACKAKSESTGKSSTRRVRRSVMATLSLYPPRDRLKSSRHSPTHHVSRVASCGTSPSLLGNLGRSVLRCG